MFWQGGRKRGGGQINPGLKKSKPPKFRGWVQYGAMVFLPFFHQKGGSIPLSLPRYTEDSPNGMAAVQKTDKRETSWGFDSSIFRHGSTSLFCWVGPSRAPVAIPSRKADTEQ